MLQGIASRTLQNRLALLLITGAAAFLRLYRLGDWSFWEDESFTLSGKEDGFTYTFIRHSLTTDLIQQFTLRWGKDEWTARLIPALIGIATIPVFYFLLRRAFSSNVALLATAGLAVSTWHLYWSQSARFYVSLLLFYTLASVFFYYGLEENRPQFMLWALISFGLAIKERLLAAFLLPVAGLYIASILLLKVRATTWAHLAQLGDLLRTRGAGRFVLPFSIHPRSFWLVCRLLADQQRSTLAGCWSGLLYRNRNSRSGVAGDRNGISAPRSGRYVLRSECGSSAGLAHGAIAVPIYCQPLCVSLAHRAGSCWPVFALLECGGRLPRI